jgi:hypothetical protein
VGADEYVVRLQVLDVIHAPVTGGAHVRGDLVRSGDVGLGEGDQRPVGEQVVAQQGGQLLRALGRQERPDPERAALVPQPAEHLGGVAGQQRQLVVTQGLTQVTPYAEL